MQGASKTKPKAVPAPEKGSGFLVIGYGNELRGDDALGPMVARAIDALNLPGVSVMERHQLTPELCEPVSLAGSVVFVDASIAPDARPVRARRLRRCPAPPMAAHASDPRTVLALAEALYERRPPAWLVAVPALQFEMGAALSAQAVRGLKAAVRVVAALIRQQQKTEAKPHPRRGAGFQPAVSPTSSRPPVRSPKRVRGRSRV